MKKRFRIIFSEHYVYLFKSSLFNESVDSKELLNRFLYSHRIKR